MFIPYRNGGRMLSQATIEKNLEHQLGSDVSEGIFSKLPGASRCDISAGRDIHRSVPGPCTHWERS